MSYDRMPSTRELIAERMDARLVTTRCSCCGFATLYPLIYRDGTTVLLCSRCDVET